MTSPPNPFRRVAKKLLALMCAGLFTAAAFAQEGSVKMSASNMTVRHALGEIEVQTGKIFGVSEHFDVTRSVDFGRTEMPLVVAVDKIAGKDFTARYYNQHILIYRKNSDKPKSQSLRYINGVIRDEGSLPLVGASVEIINRKGSSATTDNNGHFYIGDIPEGRYIMKITTADGLGMQYNEIVAGDNSTTVEMVFRTPRTHEGASQSEYLEIVDVTSYSIVDNAPAVTYYYDNKADAASVGGPVDYSYILARELYDGGYAPKIAAKTNFVWWATTSVNFAAEVYLGKKWTLNAAVVYNPWRFGSEKTHRFWLVQPEVRYWFCKSFEKHFIGLHGIYGEYNIGNSKLPFTDKFDEHKYKGEGYGAGVSYGYHMPIGKRWGMEFTIGGGYVHLDYKKYRCSSCDEFEGKHRYDYFGITNAGISLMYFIH